LREDFHLSYPQVFLEGGAIWMVPEARQSGAVRLYRADDFPKRWVHERDLLPLGFVDPTIFKRDELWWMYATERGQPTDVLRLFFADELCADWVEHPASPLVVGDKQTSRSGGRPFEFAGRFFRVAQDGRRWYGERLVTVEILELTSEAYREAEPQPFREPSGQGWQSLGVHHIDLVPTGTGWLAAVDGAGPARWDRIGPRYGAR
jgi:hypothetical protein